MSLWNASLTIPLSCITFVRVLYCLSKEERILSLSFRKQVNPSKLQSWFCVHEDTHFLSKIWSIDFIRFPKGPIENVENRWDSRINLSSLAWQIRTSTMWLLPTHFFLRFCALLIPSCLEFRTSACCPCSAALSLLLLFPSGAPRCYFPWLRPVGSQCLGTASSPPPPGAFQNPQSGLSTPPEFL